VLLVLQFNVCSGGGRSYGRLSVCLFFLQDVSKSDAARITKLDIEMFLETHLFWCRRVKGQGSFVRSLLRAVVNSLL